MTTDPAGELRPRLVRYAASVLRREAAAEDAVQDVLCRALAADLPAEPGRRRAWLFAAVRNRCVDYLRKEGRMSAVLELQELQPAPPPDPAIVAETHDEADHALAALDRLPASQRDALRLRFAGGMSYKQIAEATGKTVSHVGVLIHEGLKTLRRDLGAEVTQ